MRQVAASGLGEAITSLPCLDNIHKITSQDIEIYSVTIGLQSQGMITVLMLTKVMLTKSRLSDSLSEGRGGGGYIRIQ